MIWFLRQRETNAPISGLILKEKAKYFHEKLYDKYSTFSANSGWLQQFKKRFGIRFLTITGEKLSSQPELVSPFLRKLEEKIKDLNLDYNQVYNADQTGLYWKLLPGKTYVSSEEKTAPGRKTAKEKITFLACTNATGLHKLTPLVIGKAKKPRSFKNSYIPVHYKNSQSAWMTAGILKEWFKEIFVPEVRKFLKKQGLFYWIMPPVIPQ
ncbi:jerky protein homolog-like [Anthonomus grandis grandis]|uniref:jerky protein homolog-like n=1 Tax=Anthonomus grandis grandis TaxID=2921223 RepID=UPI0021663684|nr:jerky protein homolog-like [Anthonomus grandis grandis]